MLTRYEPFGAMRQLREQMNQAFGNALTANDDRSNVATSRWTPAVDIKEEHDQFVICADIPGVEPNDIEITMENGNITIRGERKTESKHDSRAGSERLERVHGSFYRCFALPDTADAQAISATGTHGVLEIVIPKKAAVQPKRIQVGT
jgi:HSP20 family protein